MTTELLYRDDAYLQAAAARVLAAGPEGILLDRTPFYAQAGGQPGDAGLLRWAGGETPILKAIKGEADAVLHLPAEGAALPAPGTVVEAPNNSRKFRQQQGSPKDCCQKALATRESSD
jgi:misacylated tRNA(Ala) deacylase